MTEERLPGATKPQIPGGRSLLPPNPSLALAWIVVLILVSVYGASLTVAAGGSEPELDLAQHAAPQQVADDVLLDAPVEQVVHLDRGDDPAACHFTPKLPFTVAYQSV